MKNTVAMIAIGIATILIGLILIVTGLSSSEEGHTAIVIDKYKVKGLHIVEVAVPVDADLYIGLDIGDEVSLENE